MFVYIFGRVATRALGAIVLKKMEAKNEKNENNGAKM